MPGSSISPTRSRSSTAAAPPMWSRCGCVSTIAVERADPHVSQLARRRPPRAAPRPRAPLLPETSSSAESPWPTSRNVTRSPCGGAHDGDGRSAHAPAAVARASDTSPDDRGPAAIAGQAPDDGRRGGEGQDRRQRDGRVDLCRRPAAHDPRDERDPRARSRRRATRARPRRREARARSPPPPATARSAAASPAPRRRSPAPSRARPRRSGARRSARSRARTRPRPRGRPRARAGSGTRPGRRRRVVRRRRSPQPPRTTAGTPGRAPPTASMRGGRARRPPSRAIGLAAAR